MAFGIPTDIPSIAGLASVVTPSLTMPLNAKEVITDLTSKTRTQLFSNPMVSTIENMSSTATTLQTRLQAIASGSVVNDLITAGDATTYLAGTGLSDLTASLSAFTLHTDRLSGVLQGQGITAPGLEQIATIGRQMNTMANLIDGSSGCLNVIGSMTGMFSQDQINGLAGAVGSAIARIDREVMTISEISDLVINTKNQITAIINKDTNFLGQCVEQLKNAAFGYSLSSMMSDPCSKFIVEQTGTSDFLRKLQ